MRLEKKQVSVRILGWPAIEARFFVGREFCLEGGTDFLREIGLNRKDIGQIAVVIFRPNVLVGVGVDQLDVDAHAIADPANAPFEKGCHAQRLADFTRLANARLTIGHD